MDQFVTLLTYFAILSMAAERLTDMLKRGLLSRFTKLNGVVYQAISAVFGGALAYTSPPVFGNMHLPIWGVVIISGLAVSGGSGFWNSILETMATFKKQAKELEPKELAK